MARKAKTPPALLTRQELEARRAALVEREQVIADELTRISDDIAAATINGGDVSALMARRLELVNEREVIPATLVRFDHMIRESRRCELLERLPQIEAQRLEIVAREQARSAQIRELQQQIDELQRENIRDLRQREILSERAASANKQLREFST